MRKKLLKYAAALAALGIMGLAMSITSHAAQTAAETAGGDGLPDKIEGVFGGSQCF